MTMRVGETQEAATRLLMVEDEADTAVLMRYVLEAKGFHVRSVTTGQAAKGVLDGGGLPISSCWISRCRTWADSSFCA